MRVVALLAFFLCAACDETRATAAPAAEPSPSAPAPSAPPEPEPSPEPEPEEPTAPRDVDDMSDDDLELACFEGSQAACDRLGH